MEFFIKVAGIYIILAYLVGIVPIQIVQFYLYKIPLVFVCQGKHLVKYCLFTMERETQVTDSANLALLHQIINNAIVDIATLKLIHTSTNGVKQIVIDIVNLQLLHRVLIHFDSLVTLPIVTIKVREFGGYEILITLVAT